MTETLSTGKPSLLDRIQSHAGQPETLIGVLHLVQEELGYIPKNLQKRIAETLGVSIGRVHGVVTFYHFFRTNPVGRHTIRLCLGTACYVRGAQRAVDLLQDELGIGVGETMDDGLFTLEAVRCLGTCALAPAMVIDDEVHGRLTPESMRGILATFRDNAPSKELP